MNGRISQIHPIKPGSKFPKGFQRLTFALEDGSWAKTDVVPTYRNFRFWKRLLKVGNILGGLRWKNQDKRTIDADTAPELITEAEFNPSPKRTEPDPQLSLL